MLKPSEDQVSRLKRERIAKLEQELEVVLQQEAEHRKKGNIRVSGGFFGEEVTSFGGEVASFAQAGNEVSSRLQERLSFLKHDLSMPISDKIIGPRYKEGTWGGFTIDGQKEYTKDEFMPTVMSNQNREQYHKINLEGKGWTIRSLDGIKFSKLFYTGEGPVTQGGRHYQSSGINLRRCRIQTLGSVKFPPVIYELDLGQNDILHLNNVTFPPCHYLHLNSNLISSLAGCTFPEGIEIINLVDNLISNFEDLNVKALPMSLKHIHLGGNPMTKGLSQDEMEVLNRKILYKIAKERNRAKQPSPVMQPPDPSAPPLSVDDLLGMDGGSKRIISKSSKNKRLHKYKKTNKRRKSKK